MRKRIIFLLTATMCILNVLGDTIVLKNGTTMTVYNIERGEKSLIYTETENPDAFMKKIPLEECFAIKIGDGEMEVIAVTTTSNNNTIQTSANTSTSTSSMFIEPKADSNNKDLINRYNAATITYKNPKRKPLKSEKTDKAFLLLGITDDSVISDNNVEILFEEEIKCYEWGMVMEKNLIKYPKEVIVKVRNKSNRPVYVNVPNSFRIKSDGSSESFSNNMSITNTSSSSSGGAVNFGGVTQAIGIGGALGKLASGLTFGGGSSSGQQITEFEQTVLTIPPGGIVEMPQKIVLRDDTPVKYYEELTATLTDELISNLELNSYSYTDFGLDNLSKACRILISYSTESDFSKYTMLPITFYVRGVYGVKSYRCEEDYEFDRQHTLFKRYMKK